MNNISKIFIGITAIFAWQCSDQKNWMEPKDDIPPGPVTNVHVTNLNGGALIEYTKPSDPDLMGVKAVYRFNEKDEWREMWASALSDFILLDGYSNTDEHIVELYAVDESGNLSKPEQIRIKPLTPPIELIRKTLEVRSAFGGVRANWKNPWRKMMNVTLYTFEPDGEKIVWDRYFSNGEQDGYTFRKFEAEERKFCIELCDRWGNTSIPLDTLLTPLFETQIIGRTPPPNSVNIWSQYGHSSNTAKQRGEVFQMSSGTTNFSIIHNGVYNDGGVTFWSVFPHTLDDFYPGQELSKSNALAPMYFIINMGKKATYSRLKLWYRDRPQGVYSAYIWYEFEIWGANSVKALTGETLKDLQYWTAWEDIEATDQWKEGWEKLCTCVIKFPSGTPNNVTELVNSEDLEFFANGFDFPIDEEMVFKPFQYLRFVMLKQNIPENRIQFAELQFFGAYAD